ncbi:NAD(P)-binding protein [Apiospora saccharicola]|uniref:NAD(P)-binding protein n=1 Tax=Apiospora saccharicola TaxID=335842 RepID=A0ABR1UEP4_9PEZI
MTPPALDNTEKRAGFKSFVHRQLFEKPTLPEDVDLRGKTAIVTGSNTGIGLECARQLLNLGLLAILLLPIVKAKCAATGVPGRIAVVQSDTASWAKFAEKKHVPLLPALDDEKNFDRVDRYFTSKLILQLFVTELTKRVPATAAVVTMPNPGWMYGTGRGTVAEKIIAVPNRLLGRTPSAAARVVTTGAVAFGAEAHGQYIEDGKLQPKAPFVYTPEGEKVGKTIWDEVMSELSFANVKEIVRELEKEA